jgi:hypothetical protein
VITSTSYKSWRTSETVRFGTIWDNHTISQTWHVERVDGNALKPNDISAILLEAGTQVIPGIDDPYFFPTGGLGTSWMESALVRSLTFNAMEGKGLSVQVDYGTRYFETNAAKGMDSASEDAGAATTLGVGLFLPCMCLPIFATRSFVRYRDGATNPPPTLDISAADIGGTHKEIEQDSRQIGLKLRFIQDTNSISMLGVGTTDGMVQVAQACLGYKNTAAFLGQAAQTLICSGCTINHLEGEFYEFVLEFLYDEYYHHSMVFKRATDGRPEMDSTTSPPKYAEVKWTRPARGAVNFNDIWPSGDLGKSLKYQAFMGRWY